MVANHLTHEARLENMRALALAAGISSDAAAERLSGYILCSFNESDEAAVQLFNELCPVLSRTISTSAVLIEASQYLAEVVIGGAHARSSAQVLHVKLRSGGCVISDEPKEGHETQPCHPLLALLAACYVSSKAIHAAVGQGLPNPPPARFELIYEEVVPDPAILHRPVELGHAYLAGAGAIGNGFLWAARHIDLRGNLNVCDDDTVSSGNLQRQVWFDEEDIGQSKAEIVCSKAQALLPGCKLVPRVSRLQELPERSGAWLSRLIVGVDSRRARRELQNEMPAEVFDASTTDIREIVLHYNHVSNGLACLGCLYKADEHEASQDEIIAEHLGVSVEEVKTSRVSSEVALRIAAKHAHIAPEAIVGLAFDSLYKTLCATGKLHASIGKQVVAPFAFVSVLAGALLLIEMMHRLSATRDNANEWRISPWREPFRQGRHTRLRFNGCECCGKPILERMRHKLWTQGSPRA
jgi:molybdopterin/thiamine biosynthesis adenylyltransferase